MKKWTAFDWLTAFIVGLVILVIITEVILPIVGLAYLIRHM